MGAITYEQEISTSIPPKRLFKSFVLDGDNLVPKVMPQAIKSIDIIEGTGGAGTKKCLTFGEGSQFNSVIHRIDEVDEVNHVYKYSIVGGDALGDVLDSISYVIKYEPSPDGGSICKSTSTYHTKSEDHHITEEKIKEGKAKAKALFHAVEAHLIAHPDEYCD